MSGLLVAALTTAASKPLAHDGLVVTRNPAVPAKAALVGDLGPCALLLGGVGAASARLLPANRVRPVYCTQ